MEARGKRSLEDDLPVDVVDADGQATALTSGLQLVRIVYPDDVGFTAVSCREDHAEGMDRHVRGSLGYFDNIHSRDD